MCPARNVCRLLAAVLVVGLGAACGDSTGPGNGTVIVTATTSGANPDPDGYTVAADSGSNQALASGGTVRLEGLASGSHAIHIGGVATNCFVHGGSDQSVTVAAGGQVRLQLRIDCFDLTADHIYFSTNGIEPGVTGLVRELRVVRPDGTGLRTILVQNGVPAQPSASPSGGPVAFALIHELLCELPGGMHQACNTADLAIINSDGTGQTTLAGLPPPSASDSFALPVFAMDPVGLHVAFVARDGTLALIGIDGSGLIVLAAPTPGAAITSPTWSPDGTRLAFLQGELTSPGVQWLTVINADGSGRHDLTNPTIESANRPGWSPEGTRLAFAERTGASLGFGAPALTVMNTDGSRRRTLAEDLVVESGAPAWSPDGTKIAFEALNPLMNFDQDIYVTSSDGTDVVNLTQHPGPDSDPVWSPEGGRIAFRTFGQDVGFGVELFAMTANGSGLTRLSDVYPSAPVWVAR